MSRGDAIINSVAWSPGMFLFNLILKEFFGLNSEDYFIHWNKKNIKLVVFYLF